MNLFRRSWRWLWSLLRRPLAWRKSLVAELTADLNSTAETLHFAHVVLEGERVLREKAEEERDAALKALLSLTRLLDEHPEGWNEGPCECQLCMSYAAQDI